MSLYDPGPLIALSSLGTTGFRRPYITPPRLPELRVFAAEVLMVGLSMNRGHTLPNSKTFGCLRTSGSNAGWGPVKSALFSFNFLQRCPLLGPNPWVTLVCVCVCVCQAPVFTHNDSSAHTVPVSARKLPPRRFVLLFFRPHQRPGMRAQGQQLSFDSWITSRNVTLTTFMRYAGRAVRSLIPPSYVRMKDKWHWHILQICQGPSSRCFHRIDRRHQIIRAAADRRLELSQPPIMVEGNRWMLSRYERKKLRSTWRAHM